MAFGSAALADPLGDPKDLMIRSFFIDLSRSTQNLDFGTSCSTTGVLRRIYRLTPLPPTP